MISGYKDATSYYLVRKAMKLMNRTQLSSLAIVLVTTIGTVTAQADWLQKGKEMLNSAGGSSTVSSALSNEDVVAGLKEALSVGTEKVVTQLGAPGGFSDDPAIRIPLPESLQTVKSTLDKVGMGSMMDDLDLRVNKAAEAAMPKTKQLFINAISEMNLKDAKGILGGPENAATQYFQQKMTPDLKKEMRPVVDSSLAEVGAIQSYDNVMEKYKSIPFVPNVNADLSDYVVGKASDGLFHYLALEEASIRKDPTKRTTDLLKKVFQSQ
jgi:hypothetical protein